MTRRILRSPRAPAAQAAAAAAVLAVVGLVAGIGVAHDRATTTRLAHGSASQPPWPAPVGDAQRERAAAADLPNVYGVKLAQHIHVHLTITVDGVTQTVPAHIGLDEPHRYATALHTHDTSGIIHVESPTRRDFTLGQLFTEWDVRLDVNHVGATGSEVGSRLTTFVDGRRRAGNPASIVLHNLDDIDLVVAPAGTRARPAAPFAWPANYR